MKLISVLMSVYDEPRVFVEKAVNSILNQTYKNFEFLIVVDKPDNYQIISYLRNIETSDSRVKVFINERNFGLAKSLNRAIDNAEGVYFARMDADDISLPKRFEDELSYLQEKKLDVIGCIADIIDENDQIWGEISSFPENKTAVLKMLPYQNVLIHPTVFMKADVIKSVGGYRNFPTCQDYDLWLRLITDGYKIGILNKKLFYFRKHDSSITSTKRYSQVLNERYIRMLYKERSISGKEDSFSEDNLKAFLKSHGFFDENRFSKENTLLNNYKLGIKEIRAHNVLHGAGMVLHSLISREVRQCAVNSIKIKRIRKKLG